MKSPDQRFELIVHSRDDDSYFYSDTDTTWHVRSLETGDELAAFHGSERAGRDGSHASGVDRVAFSESGDAVVATHHDGRVERVALPRRVEIVDGGRGVLLTYARGRTERRARRRVAYTLKFGQPVSHPLLDEP